MRSANRPAPIDEGAILVRHRGAGERQLRDKRKRAEHYGLVNEVDREAMASSKGKGAPRRASRGPKRRGACRETRQGEPRQRHAGEEGRKPGKDRFEIERRRRGGG